MERPYEYGGYVVCIWISFSDLVWIGYSFIIADMDMDTNVMNMNMTANLGYGLRWRMDLLRHNEALYAMKMEYRCSSALNLRVGKRKMQDPVRFRSGNDL